MASKNGLKSAELKARVKSVILNAKKNNLIKPHTEAFKDNPGKKMQLKQAK